MVFIKSFSSKKKYLDWHGKNATHGFDPSLYYGSYKLLNTLTRKSNAIKMAKRYDLKSGARGLKKSDIIIAGARGLWGIYH